ncbi:hypothetical protein [Metapseudomonas otitidis]|uniref:hypothetical protein n=1 Tax=Metapseudomonas otitidis TaxID=319939 RepID=UPI0013E0972F|nr:hypothetical protein [Pseudomonas otitidis]MDH0334388.1 hypothetical protein [Pseudomonas otitidis]
MVGLVLPSSMQGRPAWRQLLPAGFAGFDPEQPCGYWPSLWRRWLGYRDSDPAFAAFLAFLESLPGQPELSREALAEQLAAHLARPRNRFFLFVVWFFREGAQPTPLASLPDLSALLGEQHWATFCRWHRKYHTDFVALQCLQAWERQPEVKAAYQYRGVDLSGALDYQAFPRMLDSLFNAFSAE